MRRLGPALNTAAVAAVGAVTYPALLFLVLGTSFSPFATESSWGLAAEHGELELEHLSHFIVAIIGAVPLAISFTVTVGRFAFPVVLASSIFSALPYAAQPTHAFAANDGWLANYTWQVAAAEAALAPLLAIAAIRTASWLKSRAC